MGEIKSVDSPDLLAADGADGLLSAVGFQRKGGFTWFFSSLPPFDHASLNSAKSLLTNSRLCAAKMKV